MKYGFLGLSILSCCALNAQEDPELALNCRATQRKAKSEQARQCFHPGEDSLPCTMQSTYNYPATGKICDQFGAFVTASYLYWFAEQEGMDLATSATFDTLTGLVLPTDGGSKAIFQDAKYSSGFKVGLGWNLNQCDHWVVRADYTRLHEHTKQNEEAPEVEVPFGIALITSEPTIYATSWFFQNSALGQPIAAQSFSSSWHMNLDLIDLLASRPYYQGRSLVVSPYGGLKAAFIRQNLRIAADSFQNVIPPVQPVVSHNKSHSWGIGPSGGVCTHWILGGGFRFEGNMGASLLFTQYTHVQHSEDAITLTYPVSYSFKNYNCLRPMAEMDLGLGWMHTFNNSFALDINVTYDFNYLWGQNMMRTLNDLNIIGVNAASNDLYLHGLTVSAGFGF